ncbi:AAA family ATPase [Candidatus Woesearchaeota archaeon]|nr:AAA family ATPase [Candidatus Woesearchaeota archaeon]
MNYFLIIRGPAGVGKSTISKDVARKISAEVIHFDKIMNELSLDHIQGEKWIPLHKFLKADKMMIQKFKEILKNKNLILDGNFYHQEQIEDLVKSLDFPHFVFTLKADLQECIKRDKTRSRKLGEQATKDVFNLVSAFNYGIIINTSNKMPAGVVNEILSHLPKSK